MFCNSDAFTAEKQIKSSSDCEILCDTDKNEKNDQNIEKKNLCDK